VAAPDVPGGDPLSMEGCLVGYIDRLLLPGRLLYNKGTFDPEGLFSALPAVVTAMLGVFTGELIRNNKISGNKKTLWMLGSAVVLALVAWAFDGVLPINKKLWSSTFVCAVGSYSLIMMALFYYIIDVRGWQKWTFPFRIIGMNSITIYMVQRIVNFGGISRFFLGGIAGLCNEQWGAVINAAGFVMVGWLFLYFLYRQKIFLKI
jgi:predicted acyltransferase